MHIRPVNRWRCELDLLEGVLLHPPIARVTAPLGEAIREACDSANVAGDAASSSSEPESDYHSTVMEEEIDVIETLLGSTFVVCQPYITAIVSQILRMGRRRFMGGFGVTLAEKLGTKWKILQIELPDDSKDAFSPVQVIDAYANWFKHHDEWVCGWNTQRARGTVAVLTATGATEYSTGVMRHGADAVGMADYWETWKLSEIVGRWHTRLCTECRQLLEDEGLI